MSKHYNRSCLRRTCFVRLTDEKYRDRPMELVDTTLSLVAEKTGHRQILTLDSDFLSILSDWRSR